MREPLNIACIGTRGIPSNYSGLERACEGLYSALAKRGHAITVYCRPQLTEDTPQKYRGIQLRSVPGIRSKSLDTLSHVGASLAHALLFGHYDIIHLHALAPCVYSRLCRASGVPTVTTIHGLDWQRAKWKGLGARVLQFAETTMVRNVDQILVVSRDLQEYFANRYGRKAAYLPNGVEPVSDSEFEESTVLQEFGLKSRGFILYLGRLVPEKRIEDLLIAYRGVQSHYKLVIAGESGFTDSYVADLRGLGAADARVVFVGLQKKAAVHQLLHHALLFASPSALEGLPMSLLECMQHATPAVVSDIPSHRELVGMVEGYDLFFPPANIGALQTQLRRALQGQEEYRRIAEAGKAFVLKVHSWPEIAERTEAVLYDVVDRSSRRPRTGWTNREMLPNVEEVNRRM